MIVLAVRGVWAWLHRNDREPAEALSRQQLWFSWQGAILLGVALVVLAPSVEGLIAQRRDAPCQGWNPWIRAINAQSPTTNQRLEKIGTATASELMTIAEAFRADAQRQRAVNSPPAGQAMNEQVAVVFDGWAGITEAMANGTYSESMLYQLQAEDDELERLTDEANVRCAGS